ncbi:hypothetical protein GIS00_25955 [Nakamurella sp. YIM 132087]|uniref:VCBS repeat-containing protein n=1 Tax=Nakamurella alba TaxID=2665158 RepID=A0A7K1FTG7_9ACTN|nr:VCBS repeat-containing protein [Nakamurella alba]MTD17380.1 hypothetical protein [Nakamurella alba]
MTGRRSLLRRAGSGMLAVMLAAATMVVVAAPASAVATAYGKTISGSIAVSGERDVYTFAGAAGDRLSIDEITGSGSMRMSLKAPNGLLVWDEIYYSDNYVDLEASGTWTLTVSYGTYTYTGAYSFAINNVKNPQSFARPYGSTITQNVPSIFKSGPTPSVNGVYTPLSGDFDGDGRADIFYYAPGAVGEAMWFGTATGAFTPVAVPGISVSASYRPVVGDFTGDGKDDIFWYAPGAGAESLWKGRATIRTAGFAKAAGRTVSGTYTPLAGDWNADGNTDIYWYGPGTAKDFLWYGQDNGSFTDGPTFVVSGNYVLTAVNVDGVPGDDVVFYSPSTGALYLWWSRGGRPVDSRKVFGSPGKNKVPVGGDFDDDGYGDVLFYQPGAGADVLRRGTANGFTSGPVVTVNGDYKPVAGDFNGDGHGDIFWYGTGTKADSLSLGVTPERAGAGNIELPGASDEYTFVGKVGDRLSIDELTGSSLRMTLIAPNGARVWNDEYWGDRYLDLTQNGTYRLRVSYGPYVYTGAYSFKLNNTATPQAFTVKYGDTVGTGYPGRGSASIELPGGSDQYNFTAKAGDRLSIDELTGSSLRMTLTAPNGATIWNDEYWGDRYVDLTQNGTYKFKVSYGPYAYTGTYSFKINNTAAPQVFTAKYGDTIQAGYPGAGAANIELPGSADQYNFAGRNGDRLSIDALTGSSLRVTLTAPNGATIWNDEYWGDRYVDLTQNGTYKLKISYGPYAYTGTYSFQLLKAN